MIGRVRPLVAGLTSLPVRVAISAGLLTVVALSVDWAALEDALSGAGWGWFALATGLLFTSLIVGAVRWHAFLRAAGMGLTLSSAIRAYGIGAFANNLLPTGFGGDAVRAWLVARRGRPLVRSLTSVAVDRATALACLLILAWVGVAISPDSIPTGLTVLLGAATLIGSLGAIAMIAALRRRGLGRFLPEPLRPWTREVAETLRGYGRDRGLTVRAAVLGLAFQASIITATWMLAKALGLRLDPPILAVVVPLVLIATLVPISIAGFGVREAAFVGLLGEVGTSSADAVVLSLMAVTSLAIASLPGGLALVLGHVHLETPHEVLEDVSRPGAEAASPASLRGAGGDEVA